MTQARNTAATGLEAQQQRMDIIAANLANDNTAGYKATRADFKDALYTGMVDPVGNPEANNLRKGTGVLLNATGRDLTDGATQTTGRALDFSLSGEGYFVVQGADGGRLYTRNGHFSVSPENGQNYLVDDQGRYVLSVQGQRISVSGQGEISVRADGMISVGGQTAGQLALMDFNNPQGLSAAGDSCFQESAASGAPRTAQTCQVAQGSLEGSNVDVGEEMTLMIRAQRAYTMAGKALQTADDMDGLANSIRQ